MRGSISAVVVVVVSVAALAQELLPEVAGESGKYRAAVAALEQSRLAEAGRAAQAYVSALDGVGKSATAKGEVPVIEAVAKEREAALAGALPQELPACLPALRLQGTRKALWLKLDTINAHAAAKRKPFEAQYLGALAALAARAAPDSALAKQVAAEKAAVLAAGKPAGNGENSGDANAAKAPRGKNAVVNGDFEKVGADGGPEGWKGVRYVTVESENGNRFVRFVDGPLNRDGTTRHQAITEEIEVPKQARTVRIGARVRVKTPADFRAKEGKKPRVYLQLLDPSDKPFVWFHGVWDGPQGRWTDIEEENVLPQNAVRVQVIVTNDYWPGQVDFDDIEVAFK